MIEVRRVAPRDWRVLRDIRLTALRADPYAFSSTYEREAAFDERTWRQRAAGACWLAWRGDRPVGIVAGLAEDGGPPDERHIVSMWVDPAARGSGVADALMAEVTGWARRQGARRVRLWVADASPRARAFYRRAGFRPTGARQPVRADAAEQEAELSLDLATAGQPGEAR